VSSSAVFALRELRSDVEGASGSASLLGVHGFRRELSFLRAPFRRADEGCGVLIFSSVGSFDWLSTVSLASSCGAVGTDSAEDMAALPLAFLERAGFFWESPLVRLARLLRAGASSSCSGSGSGLEVGGAVFLLRVEAGARVGGGGGGGGGLGFGVLSSAEPMDRLAAERVTLDDMRLCSECARDKSTIESAVSLWPRWRVSQRCTRETE